jgi:hypothetical protein
VLWFGVYLMGPARLSAPQHHRWLNSLDLIFRPAGETNPSVIASAR